MRFAVNGLFPVAILFAIAASVSQADQEGAEPYADMFGTWSPDGTKIAFTSTRPGDPEIYIAELNGSCARPLTSVPGRDAHPSFSRDGRTIIFQSPRNGGDTRIFTMAADGTDQRELLKTSGFCGMPVYAPDGGAIAFMCSAATADLGTEAAPWRIFLAKANGSGLRQLTEGPGNDQVPNWSPGGAEILFHSDRGGDNQLYRIHTKDGTAVQVTAGPGQNKSGSFSPDGQSLVFMSNREGGRWDVYVASADGSGAHRVTDIGNEYGTPLFSPDGRQILISLRPPEGPRIGVINRDGSGFRQLDFKDCGPARAN